MLVNTKYINSTRGISSKYTHTHSHTHTHTCTSYVHILQSSPAGSNLDLDWQLNSKWGGGLHALFNDAGDLGHLRACHLIDEFIMELQYQKGTSVLSGLCTDHNHIVIRSSASIQTATL